jgi:hypothetical protein
MKTIQINNQYKINVTKGDMITVIREGHEPNSFKIGDMAEYDSYNLSYYGPIVSITEKTVTIKDKHFDRKYRLKLDTFAWRNYNFNLEKTVQENADTMQYI